MAYFPGCSGLQGLPVFDKVDVDGVGVAVVDDKDLLIPA